MSSTRALTFLVSLFLPSTYATGCKGPPLIGDPCSLEACGIDPDQTGPGVNLVCTDATECPGLVCVSYRTDGEDRAPFCSTDCVPGDACPRDATGARGVCIVLQEVLGANETGNCTSNGNEAFCGCVPCAEVDVELCD